MSRITIVAPARSTGYSVAMPPAPKPKRHHWVPQLLLKRFAADEPPTAIHVFDKKAGRVGCWKITDTAVEGHRYPEEVEQHLSERESEVAPIIERWLASPGERLSEHDRGAIALFVALLHGRTPRASGFVKQHSQQLVPALIELIRSNPESLQRMREMVVAVDGEESVPRRKVLRHKLAAEHVGFSVEVDARKATLLAMMPIETVSAALLAMHWTLLMPPAGRTFWLADAPVLVLARDGGTVIVGGGIGLPTADVFVPFASGCALHASYRSGPPLREIDNEEHDAIRRWTLFYADRFTFSADAFDPDDPILAAAVSASPRSTINPREAKRQWTRVLRKILE